MPLSIPREEFMEKGHTACAGCGAALTMRYVLKALGPKSVVTIPASCWAVIPGEYPSISLDVPLVYTTFASTGATISGIREGLDQQGKEDYNVVGFAGDGGTADIGLQSLSAAMERGHNVLYIMYDNEAYMNTGIQRSGSTPFGAWTTTTPVGSKRNYKKQNKKSVAEMMIAQDVPYVATATIAYPEDLERKISMTKSLKGPKFIQILSPCPPGWYYNSADTVKISRLAVETKVFPIYEYIQGRFRIFKPSKILPVKEYLALQGRFAHLTDEEIAEIQLAVDQRWEELLKREKQ
ncbi:MAG: 3-methyl-2-oxobutanoate dehydrogenase subunit beta [Thermoplasmatales archaeon]